MTAETKTAEWVPLPALLDDAKEAGFDALHRGLQERGHARVRRGHGCVFRYIDREGSRLTDLAEASGHTKQAVGEAVADLETLGYVERVPDPADGRAKIIRLTERGAAGQRDAREIFTDIEGEWAEAIGAERVAALREALELIVELEAAPATPAVTR